MSALTVSPVYQVSDMERMAKALAGSKLFGIQNPEQALALCLVAQAEGRHPATAAQDYNIIQGRPAKKADAMLRDFIAGGGKVEWHTLNNDKADATFSHPSGGSARIDWDMPRAKDAGLGAKDMWKKFPRQMLRARVVSEGVRTVYPMATSGMYVPEEVQDFDTREEPRNVTPLRSVAQPSPALPVDEDPFSDHPAADEPSGAVTAAREVISRFADVDTGIAWSKANAAGLGAMKESDPDDYRAILQAYRTKMDSFEMEGAA